MPSTLWRNISNWIAGFATYALCIVTLNFRIVSPMDDWASMTKMTASVSSNERLSCSGSS